MNAAFPGRHITPPAALDSALREDPGMRLVRRVGKLELFALRGRIEPAGSVTSYATVNSATPDLRDLSLLPSGTALISSPMRPAVPAVLQVPPVSQWRLVGDKLQTSVAEPPGRQLQRRAAVSHWRVQAARCLLRFSPCPDASGRSREAAKRSPEPADTSGFE